MRIVFKSVPLGTEPRTAAAKLPARCWRELAVSRGMRAGQLQPLVRAGALRGGMAGVGPLGRGVPPRGGPAAGGKPSVWIYGIAVLGTGARADPLPPRHWVYGRRRFRNTASPAPPIQPERPRLSCRRAAGA